ncbi:DUF5685 family protein [Clostridium sp. C8]|uniref:Uncharacterized protein n=1 Tax=bioreactor metagenome TaxID=1076179 RepID=A0A644YP20_9ZZZZ|nr:DUF5685 family protein [Clostridium sp. C8]KLE14684.1 hypothetical protein AAT22_15360 [Clostridium sp. C8]
MFGYVTPLKAELKIKDFTKFRSYYCGLCFQLKNSAGNIPRMVLNYDMTFLGILLDSLSPKEPDIEIRRCMAHPTDKKPVIINNDALNYAAAMNLTLYYLKLKDDIQDDNSLKSKFLERILYPYQKKLDKSISNIRSIIKDNLRVLTNLEKNKDFESIDVISHPFSDIVGNIFKEYPGDLISDGPDLRNKLYNFGYTLGKWIYLMDAFDDLKDDIENNKFNPINYLFNKSNESYYDLIILIQERLEFTILNCSYNCKDILSKLPLKRNEDILRNILELGMMDKYIGILNNTREDKRSDNLNESI